MEHTIDREVVSGIGLSSMVGNIGYGEELFAIVLFDWSLVSLDGEMKDYSVGH
jgi:hypothetical protein